MKRDVATYNSIFTDLETQYTFEMANADRTLSEVKEKVDIILANPVRLFFLFLRFLLF